MLPTRKARVIAGRYSLDREVGRGGMSAVWLGRDEVLGRHVALKRIGLLPGADRTDLARAEREARVSARLHHPHVVAVFDAVVDGDDEAWWLVMEYVDGVDLGRLIREEGPLSPDDAAPLLAQAADGLAAAHGAGIVHRDVKPSNILVDAHRQVKLTDFGIARIATDPALTQTGLVTGSPAYLAPEVAGGDRGGEAADVWSLGATAFHLLSGRPPYDVRDNVMGALYRLVNEDPPRIDAGWLTPMLEGTMERDPSRRWTMSQVRDFLVRADRTAPLVTSPVEYDEPTATQVLATTTAAPAQPPLPPPAPTAQTTPPGRRLPGKALVALGVVLLLVLGGVGLWAALSDRDSGSKGTTAQPTKSPSSAPAAKPTAKGMETFIRDYVTTVADDPSKSWMMLTPKFQEESGGYKKYRKFWDKASNGEVLSISTNPEDLAVSYQVHFDDFDNGPGPTVLDLKFEDGKYLIDGERTQGFQPSS